MGQESGASARVVRLTGGDAVGRRATAPSRIPWRGWRQVIARVYSEISSDRVGLVAAGCAFWATLALFPAISMLISLYGLVFDLQTVEPQLRALRDFLPPATYDLIAARVHTLVSHGTGTLGVSLLVSTVIALWSASTGTKSMLSALNVAYEEKERRGFFRFQLVGITMTLASIVGAIFAIAVLVLLPNVINLIGMTGYAQGLIQVATFAVLIIFVLSMLSLLYRYGPARRSARWRWITPGSLVATVLWLLASAIFSFYVGHLTSYDATYGPLGAVAGVMMWFWVSAYVVLLGAELNAELELQTAEDSSVGPPRPLGERGSFVADHVAQGPTPMARRPSN